MEVKRITTVEQIKEHMPLFMAALESCPFVENKFHALGEVASYITDPSTGVFVVSDGGLVICWHNTGAFQSGVQMTHIYAIQPGVANKLIEAVHAFAVERGAKRVWGVDVNKRPEAHERLFRRWAPQPEGTFYSYEVK